MDLDSAFDAIRTNANINTANHRCNYRKKSCLYQDVESPDSLRGIRLRKIAPTMQGEQGINFLRSKFEDRLRNGSVTLKNTQVDILYRLLKTRYSDDNS